MKHDLKKVITDYLDGLVGKTIKLYKPKEGGIPYIYPYEGEIVNAVIKTCKLLHDEDGAFIIFQYEPPFDHNNYIDVDCEIPIFETID